MNQTNGLKALALVIAVIMWAYVRVTVGGVTQNSITQLELRIPLETKGAGSHLIPYEKSADTVKLTLRGDSEVVTELREGLVRAYVDLENMAAGSAWPEVQVLVPAGVQILDVDPNSVNVQISPLMVKEVPIKIETVGAPKTGFKVGIPIFEPRSTKIEGPEDLVRQVSVVSGVVPVEGLGDTLSIRVSNLTPLNDNGTTVMGTDSSLRLDVREVMATIPIDQQQTLESLPVLIDNVKVEGEPGYRYRPEVEPQFVQVARTIGGAAPKGLQVTPIVFEPKGGKTEVAQVKLLPVDGVTFVGSDLVTITLLATKVNEDSGR